MSEPIKVAIVFGTRPEAVKLLVLIKLLRADDRFAPRVFVTGQHRDMPEEILRPFAVAPDVNLGIMKTKQSLNEILYRILPPLDDLFANERPQLVVVQGDTTSAFGAALAAFHRGVPVAHVEAGLRSFDRFHPYPEEANRRMLSNVSDLHFAPTPYAAENLLREGVPREEIVVAGNTVVDALLLAIEQPRAELPRARTGSDGRMVLVTLHRREGWEPVSGEAPLEAILREIRTASEEHPSVDFVYPVHHNPRVREPANRILGGRDNVSLIDPLPYIPFVHLMARATAILTDSGGIQEEAPSLGVPVLVLRRTTERPEGMASQKRLLGDSPLHIREQLGRLLGQASDRPRQLPYPNPFGDGQASERIRDAILHYMGRGDRPEEFGEPRPMQSRRGPGPR